MISFSKQTWWLMIEYAQTSVPSTLYLRDLSLAEIFMSARTYRTLDWNMKNYRHYIFLYVYSFKDREIEVHSQQLLGVKRFQRFRILNSPQFLNSKEFFHYSGNYKLKFKTGYYNFYPNRRRASETHLLFHNENIIKKFSQILFLYCFFVFTILLYLYYRTFIFW